MNDLIAKLESAKEGSDELDGRIWCELNGKRFKEAFESHIWHSCSVFYTEPPKRTQRVQNKIPNYSRSLDAALTLVPEGWHVSKIANYWGYFPGPELGDKGWVAILRQLRGPLEDAEAYGRPSAALALCIAALKARAQ